MMTKVQFRNLAAMSLRLSRATTDVTLAARLAFLAADYEEKALGAPDDEPPPPDAHKADSDDCGDGRATKQVAR